MSLFYCDACQKIEDSDVVGYEITRNGVEVCADAYHVEEQILSQNASDMEMAITLGYDTDA